MVKMLDTINKDNYTIKFEVKTKLKSNNFPSLCANKKWDGAETIDLISKHNMGKSLVSGQNQGWCIFLQPNGAWGWNLGDEKNRLDYLPTSLQKINDGEWHEIAITFCFDKKVVWLFFDKRHVAVYSLSELNIPKDAIIQNIYFVDDNQINIKDKILESTFYKVSEDKKGAQNSLLNKNFEQEKFTIMTWNIWHGGRRNGLEKGIEQVVTAIKNAGVDILCMQETYGSGPLISDALGTIFYYRSSNLSIHSKYEIIDTYDMYESFSFGGVRIKIKEKLIDVFTLWINYLPSTSYLYDSVSVEKIINDENETRGKEIKEIIECIRNNSDLNTNLPLIVGGDFNSPSHLDWGENMKSSHRNLVIEWPVSKSMIDFGFQDSFRIRSPLPNYNLGTTWSSLYPDRLQNRIDYLYFRGGLRCVNCYVKGFEDLEWPSDHAAVIGEYYFEP